MSKNLWIIGGGKKTLAEMIHTSTEVNDQYDAILQTEQGEVDVTQRVEISSYLNHLVEWQPEMRQLDIVYCAGFNRLAPLGSLERFTLARHFDVNVIGFINLLDAIAGHSSPQSNWNWERDACVNVVAIVSDASRTAMRTSIAYCSSKAALAHAIRCGARELAPIHRVNGVSPSVIADTPMTEYVDEQVQKQRGWTAEEAFDYEKSLVPMGTRVTKTEVAEVVRSTLAGPWFQTGSIIEITGGK